MFNADKDILKDVERTEKLYRMQKQSQHDPLNIDHGLSSDSQPQTLDEVQHQLLVHPCSVPLLLQRAQIHVGTHGGGVQHMAMMKVC